MGKSAKPRRKGRTLAQRADPFDLYQRSVQGPEGDIEFFDRTFRELRGRKPKRLREDFCGTALLSTEWVRSAPGRKAVGIDLDGPTLEWARRHNLRRLSDKKRRRLRLIQADVRDGTGPKGDLACALNFSFCALHTRAALRRYFEAAHERLKSDGLLFTELYGGTEAIVAMPEEREADGFDVIWDQESYNPITHATRCHLHFAFEDGSRLERAFSYDWRLWSVPEVRELMSDAGFRDSLVYWEDVDEGGDGTGEYRLTEEEENQETWLVFIVGLK